MLEDIVPRGVARTVLDALSDTPVVAVNGPRQAGKTTLVRTLPYTGSTEFASLDDPLVRSAAASDPRSFIERSVDTLVIDEAQLEPGLFPHRDAPRPTHSGHPGQPALAAGLAVGHATSAA